MPLLSRNEESFEATMSFWVILSLPIYNNILQKKFYDKNTCSVPTLSTFCWALAARSNALARVELEQCLPFDRRPDIPSIIFELLLIWSVLFDNRGPRVAYDSSQNISRLQILLWGFT